MTTLLVKKFDQFLPYLNLGTDWKEIRTWSESTEKEIRMLLRDKNSIGIVIKFESQVVGYLIYTCEPRRYVVKKFEYDPLFQKLGVLETMLRCLIDKMMASPIKRKVVSDANEYDTDSQRRHSVVGFVGKYIDSNTVRFVVSK